MTTTVAVLVEVDEALRYAPTAQARVWTWVAVERKDRWNVDEQARLIACEMAACHPRVIMPVAACVIDWEEPECTDE